MLTCMVQVFIRFEGLEFSQYTAAALNIAYRGGASEEIKLINSLQDNFTDCS